MDTLIAITLGVLFTVFVLSAIAVLVACRRRLCRKQDATGDDLAIYSDNRGLFSNEETPDERDLDLTLDDIAKNETWVKDAMGLTPHCLAVMRTCHSLADRLLAAAVADVPRAKNGECIANVARQLTQHVEDLAGAMYPPLDPRLVEARCTALMLCMTHLVLMVKRACRLPADTTQAVGSELRELEKRLLILREESCQQNPGNAANSLMSRDGQNHALSNATLGRACWTTSASAAPQASPQASLPKF